MIIHLKWQSKRKTMVKLTAGTSAMSKQQSISKLVNFEKPKFCPEMSQKPFLNVIIFLVSRSFEYITKLVLISNKLQLPPLHPFSKRGETFFIPHKTIKSINIGGGTRIISQSIKNISKSSSTFWTLKPCLGI